MMLNALHEQLYKLLNKRTNNLLIKAVRRAGILDVKWYLKGNADVERAGLDPVEHFVLHGAGEGRLPSRGFNLKHISTTGTKKLDKLLSQFLRIHFAQSLTSMNSGRLEENLPPYLKIYNEIAYPTYSLKTAIERNALEYPVTIIVPVFNAFEELERCLESLLSSILYAAKIIVINDASTLDGFRSVTDKFARNGIKFYENIENLGFSGTVNKGIAICSEINPKSDIVILNSDTIVSKFWLHELKLVAKSDDQIGSVTAVSNDAGPFSFCSSFPEKVSLKKVDDIGDYFRKHAPAVSLRVPTGHGFCMYLSKDMLDEVGHFDQEAFPKGYGEENDLCMRALNNGWKHQVALRSFVYHRKNASFGKRKQNLVEAGRCKIDARYPHYKRLIENAFGHPDYKLLNLYLHGNLIESENDDARIKRRILFVISTESGGTPQTNLDLMKALEPQFDCFLLICNSKFVKLSLLHDGALISLFQHELTNKVDPLSHRSLEYDAIVSSWIAKINIDILHLRHIAWHSFGLLDISIGVKVPIVFSFHDFYTVCPTVKLLDGDKNYCSGKCTSPSTPCVPELWSRAELKELNKFEVFVWRKRFVPYLSKIAKFITTSESAKAVLLDSYEELKQADFKVIPHGRDFVSLTDMSQKLSHDQKITLICPGNINIAKGLKFINELAETYAHIFDIHIAGKVSNELLLSRNITLHGSYEREQFADLVKRIKPNIGGIFSLWPETWCHTLTELLSCGVPVVSFGMGAVEERIQNGKFGWILSSQNPECLVQLVSDVNFASDWKRKKEKVSDWQQSEGLYLTTEAMSKSYVRVYSSLFH